MVGIKVEGDAVKVLGGGSQNYNKDNRDKRRPTVTMSPGQRQRILKRANDPEIQELDSIIVNLSEELAMAYTTIDGLNKTLVEAQLDAEAGKEIISNQEAALAAANKPAANKPAPKKKVVSKKVAPKTGGH
jgi:hypothetical protein